MTKAAMASETDRSRNHADMSKAPRRGDLAVSVIGEEGSVPSDIVLQFYWIWMREDELGDGLDWQKSRVF